MTRTPCHIIGKAPLTLETMEKIVPGSAKAVAYGMMEVRRIIRKASKERK
ncbi:hypothetical protein [Solidesulfovibrio sp.]